MVVLQWSFLASLLCAEARVAKRDDCKVHEQVQAMRLYVPEDEGFDDARMHQYAQYLGTKADARAKLNPAMVVYCSDEAHVQSAVRYGARCGYKVTVRSGGHSYTASSSCNFDNCMQLDLSAMNATSVQGRMITTGPGINLINFAKYTLKHFLSVPHGGCSGVGFGGHFQSSAWGFMSNSHGSGLDRVESFRMVLADGTVGVYSRNDTNNTVYRSVLGSAPGSWGIITQYTVEGVPDTEVPNSRVLSVRILWSRDNFLAAWRQVQFIMEDQEEKGLRDLKPILIVSPPTEAADTEVYITVVMLWTGIDSGNMDRNGWMDLYWKPFLKLDHLPFPTTLNTIAPLSLATRMLANLWTNHNDRYAVQAFHSNYWWDDEFIELIADELEERASLIPEMYPSFQFLPLHHASQWARNAGMNALTWRDARAYVDDWMFVKNDARYEEMVQRMVGFRERTRRFWEYKEGVPDRSTWMSPSTTYPNATNLRIADIAKQFFPNATQFEELQQLKAMLDPEDVFGNVGTIPLPQALVAQV